MKLTFNELNMLIQNRIDMLCDNYASRNVEEVIKEIDSLWSRMKHEARRMAHENEEQMMKGYWIPDQETPESQILYKGKWLPGEDPTWEKADLKKQILSFNANCQGDE